MEKMNNLRDLLKHELEDLRSAEDQITAALPKMIENAKNAKLKQSLQQHLRVTEQQIRRLDRIDEMMKGNGESEGGESKGFLSGLFGGGSHRCKGMEGIISEGEKIVKEDMDPDVKDAAIIASSQKIEHYEICGYGTARAFARELGLKDVERLLTETLNEEYEADDLLTNLAVVGGLNEEAKARKNRRGSSGQGNSAGGRSKAASKSSGGKTKAASKSSAGRTKTASKGSKSASKGSKSASKKSKPASKGSKSATKSSGGRSKAASKGVSKAASRGGASKSSGRSKTAGKGSSKKAASKGRSKAASKGRR